MVKGSSNTPAVLYSERQSGPNADFNQSPGSKGKAPERPSSAGLPREDERPPLTFCYHCEHCQAVARAAEQAQSQPPSRWKLKLWDSGVDPYYEYLKKDRRDLQRAKSDLEHSLSQALTNIDSERLTYNRLLREAGETEKKLAKEKDWAKHDVADLKARLKKLQKEKTAVSQELEDERVFTAELQAEKKQNLAVVGKAQSVMVSKLSDMVSTELSDDVIRDQLDAVFVDVQEWAKENYVRRFAAEDVDKARQALITLGALAPGDDIATHHYFNFDTSVNNLLGPEDEDEYIIADILLESALSHELCVTFLGNPFVNVSASLWASEESVDDRDHGVLHKVAAHIHSKDPDKAITWRSDTIRLLMEGEDRYHPKRLAIYGKVADYFISQWGSLIRQPVAPEDKAELVDYISKFVDLASRLWCLKTDIQFYSLSHFSNTSFRARSPEMEAARVVGLAEGSTKLDGRPIPLVLRPKIDASPRLGAKGSSSGNRVVWSKGVVWVSSLPEPKRAPPKLARQLVEKPRNIVDEAYGGGGGSGEPVDTDMQDSVE